MITVSWDKKIVAWDLETGQILVTLQTGNPRVHSFKEDQIFLLSPDSLSRH